MLITQKMIKGLINNLYCGIISLNKDSTDHVKEQWEKELNI